MHAHPLADDPLRSPDADLVAVEWTSDGQTDGQRLYIAPLHRHLLDDEIFYVLSGTLGFRLNDAEVIASPGDGVMIARGVTHTWWVDSDEPARYLIVMPARVDALIQAIHDSPRDMEAMKALYAEYDAELFGWP